MFEFIEVPGAPIGKNRIRVYKDFSAFRHKTILMVLGLNGYLEGYDTLFKMFVRLGFNIVSFEHRGSGLSDNFTEKPGCHHLESEDSLLQDLEVAFSCIPPTQKIHMAGFSFGGPISLHFLKRSPLAARIEKLILFAPMIKFLTNKIPPLIARWYAWLGAKVLPEKDLYKNYGQGIYDPENHTTMMYVKAYDPLVLRKNALIATSCLIEINKLLNIAEQYKDQPNTTNMLSRKALDILFHLVNTLPNPNMVKIPTLMFTAGKEFYVDTLASIKYGMDIKNCQIVHIPQARHGVVLETPEIFKVMEQNIKIFIEDNI